MVMSYFSWNCPKAFDKVSHSHLFFKLFQYSISGKTLDWIKALGGSKQQRNWVKQVPFFNPAPKAPVKFLEIECFAFLAPQGMFIIHFMNLNALIYLLESIFLGDLPGQQAGAYIVTMLRVENLPFCEMGKNCKIKI